MGGFVTWTWQAVTLTGYSGDGVLGIQPDWFGGEGGGQPASIGGVQALMPYGVAGRPKVPDASGACHCLVGDAGAESFVIPLVDPRLYAKIPTLTEGSSCLYADWGAWIQLDDATKTINIYNPYQTTPAKTHSIQIGVDSSGQSIINILHANGPRISMVDDVVKIADKSGNVYIQVDSSGWTLWGNGKVLGAMDVGISTFPLAKSAEVIAVFQAIAAAFAAGGTGTGTVALNGAAAVQAAVQAAVGTLPTTMLKGF